MKKRGRVAKKHYGNIENGVEERGENVEGRRHLQPLYILPQATKRYYSTTHTCDLCYVKSSIRAALDTYTLLHNSHRRHFPINHFT